MNTVERCRKLLLKLGWHHPFFLPAAAKVGIYENPEIETACVYVDGTVFVSPAFAKSLPDVELIGVLAHELCHLMLMHHARVGSRDPKRWNFATDKAINHGLRAAGIALPAFALYPAQGQESFSAEELYEESEQGNGKSEGKPGEGEGKPGEGEGKPQPTAGCGVGKKPGEQGDDSSDAKQSAREWQQVAAQAKNIGQGAGTESGKILASLLTPPKSRVRYDQILRKACSQAVHAHGQDDVTYNRRNRRSPAQGPQFPGGMAYKARAAAIIDCSGSVSDADLLVAVSNVIAISKTIGLKIYLVTHDVRVQWQGWLTANVKAKEVVKALSGRGGTMFDEAYRAIAKAGGRFDCMVHLTDGEPCGQWPSKPANVKQVTVALLGSKSTRVIPNYATTIDATL